MSVRGYYAYVLGDDGHIVNRIDVLCEDDETAKRRAEQLAADQDIELWQETRMVASFHSKQQGTNESSALP